MLCRRWLGRLLQLPDRPAVQPGSERLRLASQRGVPCGRAFAARCPQIATAQPSSQVAPAGQQAALTSPALTSPAAAAPAAAQPQTAPSAATTT